MTGEAAPRLRISLAGGLLLPLLALLAWTPTPASAATDSISAVAQVCTLPVGPSCDPTQPINGPDWASSATVNGTDVWWRIVVTNTGADPLTNIVVSSSLPNSGSSPTDCEGPVPVPGNTLAAGSSYGYVCQTTNVTQQPVILMQTVTAAGDPPSGPSVISPSSAPAIAQVGPVQAFQHGYWLVGSDGGIFSFGSASFHGSTGAAVLQRPVVGIVPTVDRGGYWLDASDGGVFSFGDTQFYGSIPGLGIHPAGSGLPHSLNAPIVGMVPSHDQGGYFMVASDGGVFAFGTAPFLGSMGAAHLNRPVVGMTADPAGRGYRMVAADGGIFSFGAPFYGSLGSVHLAADIATMAPSTDGNGYYLLDHVGGVYAFGDAPYLGRA